MISLHVTSWKVVGSPSEQLWFLFVPVFRRLQARLAAQGRPGKLLIAESHVAVQRGFRLLAGMEVVRLGHLFDASVEALDYAVRLGCCGGARRRSIPSSARR
jgi:hypothetical protein